MTPVQLFISGLIFGWFLGVISLIFIVRSYFAESLKKTINEISKQYNYILNKLKRENEELKQK